MSVTFTVSGQKDIKGLLVTGGLKFTGSYVTGGDTINFGLLSIDSFAKYIKSNSPPYVCMITGQGVASGSNYTYQFIPGTTINNGKVKIYLAGTELSAGAYPAGITGDVVTFSSQFPKFQ